MSVYVVCSHNLNQHCLFIYLIDIKQYTSHDKMTQIETLVILKAANKLQSNTGLL